MMDKLRLKQLLNGNTVGGKNRIKILRYLAARDRATPYEIARDIFGNGLKFHKTVKVHLKTVEDLVGEESKGSKRLFFITEPGKFILKEIGVDLPTNATERLLQQLIAAAPFSISNEMIYFGREILTEPVLEVTREIFLEIMGRFKRGVKIDEYYGWVKFFVEEISFEPDPLVLYVSLLMYDREKKSIIPELEKIMTQDNNLPAWQKHVKEYCLKNGIESLLIATPIAKKYGAEKEMDELIKWLPPIIEKSQLFKNWIYFILAVMDFSWFLLMMDKVPLQYEELKREIKESKEPDESILDQFKKRKLKKKGGEKS